MQRFFTVITLTCLMLAFFVVDVSHANWDGNVNVAERNEDTDQDTADTAFDAVRNANILYLLAKQEYDKNAAKIERGVVVTASKLLAASVSVYISGTLTAPAAVSSLVDMLSLAGSINSSTSLLSAYEATISNKQSSIGAFELVKKRYDRTYDTLVGVLATHTGWSKYNLLIHISDDANRRNGIIHKGISGSGKHGLVGKKIWGAYDKSLPSYTCKGPCSDTFITPTLAKTSHRVKCGTAYNVWHSANLNSEFGTIISILKGRNVDQGCGQSWYECPSYPTIDASNADDLHKVRKCNKWVYTYDSHFSNRYTRTKCPKSYRNCMGHTYDHNNRVIGTTAHSDEGDSSNDETTSGLTTTPTLTYHACGVHASTISGSHSAAGCGTTGHYVCDGSSHASADCGTSGHYVCDGSDHSLQVSCTGIDSNGNNCSVSSFYACDGHICQGSSSSNNNNGNGGSSGETLTCDDCWGLYDSNDSAAVTRHTFERTCIYCSESMPACIVGYHCDDSPSSTHFFGW